MLPNLLDWEEDRGLERVFLARAPGRTVLEVHVIDRKSLLSPKPASSSMFSLLHEPWRGPPDGSPGSFPGRSIQRTRLVS